MDYGELSTDTVKLCPSAVALGGLVLKAGHAKCETVRYRRVAMLATTKVVVPPPVRELLQG
jgi:hypothetical protein